jgi:hypothetical protein
MLRHNCGVTERDSLATITAKVQASFKEVGLAPEPWSPCLLRLFGVPADTDLLATFNPQAVKARTIEALVQLALHGARRRPLVLEIENLHWIDPSSEEVLTTLVERLVGTPILVLLTYRPGYRPPWITKSYATQLTLTALGPRESRRLVQAVFGTARMSETVVQAILTRADGNPLFLEELVHTAREQDDSHRTLGVPATIQAVLAARIDRLPAEAKHVLQVAVVIGKDVAVPLLEAIARVPETVLRRGMAHLRLAWRPTTDSGVPCSSKGNTPLPGRTSRRGSPSPTRRRSRPWRSVLARRQGCDAWPMRLLRCGVWAIQHRPCNGARRRWPWPRKSLIPIA